MLDSALEGTDTSNDADNITSNDVTIEDEQSEGEFEDLENAPSSLGDERKMQKGNEKFEKEEDHGVPEQAGDEGKEKIKSEDDQLEKYEGVLDTAVSDTELMVTDPVVADEIKAVVNEIIMETLSHVAESEQTVCHEGVVLDEESENGNKKGSSSGDEELNFIEDEQEFQKDGGEETETQYETMQTETPDEEDDDFVDAEEEFMECESSTHLTAKSDDFQSGSETSLADMVTSKPIAISIKNLKSGDLANSPEDEFALSHISDSDSGSPPCPESHNVQPIPSHVPTPLPEVEKG